MTITLQDIETRGPAAITRRERLELLIEVLERVIEERRPFDMMDFFSDDHQVVGDEALDQVRCGTAGCAIGWAALDPRFQALGLRAYLKEFLGEEPTTFAHSLDDLSVDATFAMITFDPPDPKDARFRGNLAKALRVNQDEFRHIAIPTSYRDNVPAGVGGWSAILPSLVIDHVRDVVTGKIEVTIK